MIEIVLTELSLGAVILERFSWENSTLSSEAVSSVRQDIEEILVGEVEEYDLPPHRRMSFVVEYLFDTQPLVSFTVIYQVGALELSRLVHIVSGQGRTAQEVTPEVVSRVSRYERDPVV